MPDHAGAGDRSRDEAQVLAVRAGDQTAFATLFERWFDRVYDVARNVLRDDHAAADVAQDTFLAAWQQLDRLADPASFGGWVLRIARNRALDRLRQAQRTRPTEDDVVNAVHDAGRSSLGAAEPGVDPVESVAAAERDDLLRVATLALGPRDASLVDLQLRHGLTPAEIAEELGVTANAAHQQLFRMRERLGHAVGSLLLWQRGRGGCADLAATVAPTTTFDASTLGAVDRHGRSCPTCTTARAAMTAPHQLFAAVPIAAVPVALRADVVSRLAGQGIPVTSDAGAVASITEAESASTGDPNRRGVRRVVSRRAVVLTTSVAAVAAVVVGLIIVARDGDEPIAGPPVTAKAATTDVETMQPATTEPDQTVPTTEAPTARSGSTTVVPTTGAGGVAGETTRPPTTRPLTPDAAVSPTTMLATTTTTRPSTTTTAATTTTTTTTSTTTTSTTTPATSRPPTPGALVSPTTTRPPRPTSARPTTTTLAPTTTTTLAPTTATRPPTTTTTLAPTTTIGAAVVPVTTGPGGDPPGSKGPGVLTPTQDGTNPKRPDSGVPDSPVTTDAMPTIAASTVAPTAPSVTVPPAPTAPPTPPPTAPLPTTTIPPTPAPTTTLAPPPPPPTAPPAPVVVTGFSVSGGPGSVICAAPGQSPRRFQWTSSGATSASLTIAGSSRSVPVNGPYDACAASGDSATIAVSGPGGSDDRSLVVS